MIRLSDEQWERIRKHFPEERIADDRPGRKPVQRPCLRRCCGFSTPVRSGICCRKAIRTTKLSSTFSDLVLRRDFASGIDRRRQRASRRGALDEEECFIDATFVMAKGGGSEIGPTKRGKGMKIMAIVDRHGLPLSVSKLSRIHDAFAHQKRSARWSDLILDAARDLIKSLRK